MMKKTYSEEEILKSFQSAPAPVKEILTSTKLVDLIFDMIKENSLPTNKSILIAQYNRNLLLGLSSPAEVLGNLILSGIPAEKAQKILEELNQKIFIPTREKMLHGNLPGQNIKHEEALTETEGVPHPAEQVATPLQVPPPPAVQHVPALSPTEPHDHVSVHNIPPQETATPATPQTEAPGESPNPAKERPPSIGHVTDPYRESFE